MLLPIFMQRSQHGCIGTGSRAYWLYYHLPKRQPPQLTAHSSKKARWNRSGYRRLQTYISSMHVVDFTNHRIYADFNMVFRHAQSGFNTPVSGDPDVLHSNTILASKSELLRSIEDAEARGSSCTRLVLHIPCI